MTYVSNTGLIVSGLLVAFVIVISAKQRLGITRDFIIAAVRGALQLVALAAVIQMVFKAQGPLWSVLILGLMVILASRVSSKYAKGIPHVWLIVIGVLVIACAVSLVPLVATGAIESAPRILVPLGGILIGNTMNASSLFFHRYFAEEKHRSGDEDDEAVRQASFREALKASLIPAIDATKMSGLIFLPGVFLGMILAGESPLAAIKIQVVILYIILSSYCLACFCLGWCVVWLRRRSEIAAREVGTE